MILPGATLGVVGGGQLGRMFALRARSMGYQVVVLEPDPRSPAGAAADYQIEAAYDDPGALAELAERCDAITTEFENVPAPSLEALALTRVVRPSARAVSIVQDRITEKTHLQAAGLPIAPFHPIESAADLEAAGHAISGAALLKTARLGYDGKGQVAVGGPAELAAAWTRLRSVRCVLESRLTLELEISIVLARGADGAVAAFPAGENVHRDGILDTTVVPARVSAALAREAEQMACSIAASLDYVGVLGVELFVANGGRLYVNEVAPRPHNSGHYTLDACSVDQFEQQVRALCGLPLGQPQLLSPVAMVNVLGDLWGSGVPRWERALALPGLRLHLYGKAEPRPGRKMGHLTCVAETAAAALEGAVNARGALDPNCRAG
jgi:5-(carboxyamino)imidazole ribonucleotide synthase